VIELKDVSRTVMGGAGPLTILHPTTLSIEAGAAVAITGPSGSGKSTLLGLLAGLDAPTTGQIRLDGVDITALGEEALAELRGEKVGIVFQFFHLLPSLTALENVLVPMEIAGVADARKRADQLLADVGLSERSGHYPSQLSGGEQQRVAIARALRGRGEQRRVIRVGLRVEQRVRLGCRDRHVARPPREAHEHFDGTRYGRVDLGIEVSKERRARNADPQVAHLAADRGMQILRLGADADGIERIEADERIHDERRVGDAAGERPNVIVEFRQRHDAANARETVCRLETDDAAARRGVTNGRSGVRAERGGTQASRDGGARSTRRAARVVSEIPRIVHGPVMRNGRRAAVGELVHVQLAEKNRAGVAQLAHAFGIFRRHAIGVDGARGRRPDACRVDVVLEPERNAMQRSATPAARQLVGAAASVRERFVGKHRYKGAHLRVDALDAIEIGLRELDGREIACGDAAAGVFDRQLRQVVTAARLGRRARGRERGRCCGAGHGTAACDRVADRHCYLPELSTGG
jgi:predicted ABC-type transport system involved in lysophospholipase L1 biosynthesis ATPase subunit